MDKPTSKVHPALKVQDLKSDIPTNYLTEWSEVTPWHCVNSVYRAKRRCARLAWLSTVLFASFLAFYQSGFLIKAYLDESTWVTSVTYEMPEDGGLDWPNMTVCNLDFFDEPVLEATNITDPHQIASASDKRVEKAILLYRRFQEMGASNESDDDEDESEESVHVETATFSNMSLRDLLLRHRHPTSCKNTVLHCGLSDTFSLHEQLYSCCRNDSGVAQKPGCFSMQPAKVFGKSRKRIGSKNAGIYFLLDPHVEDYYHNLTLDLAPSAGLRLYFHFGALDASVAETVIIAPGTYTMVTLVLEKQRIVSQSHMIPFYKSRKGGCMDAYEYHYVDSDVYSQPLCVADCWITWSINEFGCAVTTTRLKQKWDCVGEQIQTAMQNESGKWNETYQDGFNLYTCMASCGEQCESSNVDAKTTQASFPAAPKLAAFTTYLNQAFASSNTTYTEEDAKQLIYLEMFYKTIEYRVVTKMEKTNVGQFISNIGGALSVWTGLSMLGLFQALVYWGQFAVMWLKRVIRKRAKM